ncbi:hypothetical protein [Microbulbifer sediminum]|uniref:hypothetical protein n=1 Tax=Microbulbifer sediminum TaxID=2904250 RepID=UPI001F26A842|nr:hypothetical protein [Microbulbifer sediminum]
MHNYLSRQDYLHAVFIAGFIVFSTGLPGTSSMLLRLLVFCALVAVYLAVRAAVAFHKQARPQDAGQNLMPEVKEESING